MRILLGSAVDGDSCGVDVAQPSVSIDVWTREIEAPATFTFAPGEAMGSAMVCPGEGSVCREMPAGAITFDRFVDGEGAAGSWVVYEDQQQMSGMFDAVWCEPAEPEPCG